MFADQLLVFLLIFFSQSDIAREALNFLLDHLSVAFQAFHLPLCKAAKAAEATRRCAVRLDSGPGGHCVDSKATRSLFGRANVGK
jgi:hypothetical protein